MKDLTIKHAVIVGGTSGIGRAVAEQLAAHHYRVLIVGRNAAAGAQFVRDFAPHARFVPADVSLLRGLPAVAAAIRQEFATVDLIMHTADVLITTRVNTAEGLELAIATNYYSRVWLNELLLTGPAAYSPERIVHVAAAGYPPGKNMRRMFPLPATASSFTGHGIGQVANDFYGLSLAERLREAGTVVNILNPGIVDTDIRRNGQFPGWFRLLSPVLGLLLKAFTQTTADYARKAVAVVTGQNPAAAQSVLLNAKGRPIAGAAELHDEALRRYMWEATFATIKATVGEASPASPTAPALVR